MHLHRLTLLAFTAMVLVFNTLAADAELAPEFPPGTFHDGNDYSLEKLRGSVVVLFFYEQNCPTCVRKIPDHNKIVEQFRDKPVTFIAIAAGDTADQASAYVERTKLDMPVFADKLSLMEKLYGTKISLNNINQFRVIDPQGYIVGRNMSPQTIERALAKIDTPPPAYAATDYHEQLAPVIALLNADKHREALRGLRRYLSSRDEAVKASAQSLQEAVTEQAKGWVAQGDELMETDPIQAGRLYAAASTLFPRETLGKDAKKKLSEVKSSSPVKNETAARKMYFRMVAAIDKMTPEQTPELIKFAATIAEKYPDTPTGKRCADLASRLGG